MRRASGISNQIVPEPLASTLPVKSDIEAAPWRRIHSIARHIQVDVDGAYGTLTGSVFSWSERDAARNSAWATPGVRHVADSLSVLTRCG